MEIEKNMVAVITGASRGLGVFIAKALAERGVSLVLAARSKDDLESVANDVKRAGVDVLPVVTDISDTDSLRDLLDATSKRFGRLDILVNNAGCDYAYPFDKIEISKISEMVQVNLVGLMALTRLCIPEMLKHNGGHIVNIASIAGVMPSAYQEVYTATKHGVVGFTRALRASSQDMNWPISASVICPGFMDDAGIYVNMKRDYGVKAPNALGSMSASMLGDHVIRAIEQDIPDIMMMKGAPRIATAWLALFPRVHENISAKLKTAEIFRKVAFAHAREHK